ncbi:MAG: ATP-binding protein [Actinomycetota bacterium]|nr:ATP-binding protein [Actinomycetota bacterium]
MPAVDLRLPPDVAYVGLARLIVCAAARLAGMADERVEDLRIAVSEATTNAMVAHNRDGHGAPVVLSFGPTRTSFEVTIADAGAGFEPQPPEALDDRDPLQEGGLGVTLIRGLADSVSFERGEGMRVNMRFRVGLDADGDRAQTSVDV